MEDSERFCGKLWPYQVAEYCPKCGRKAAGLMLTGPTRLTYVANCSQRTAEHLHADCQNCSFKYAVEVANAS